MCVCVCVCVCVAVQQRSNQSPQKLTQPVLVFYSPFHINCLPFWKMLETCCRNADSRLLRTMKLFF